MLRNVCMSPFQAAGDFVQELAKIFQETLEKEVQVSNGREVTWSGAC